MKAARLKWPHTFAGGTFAAEGKHGYSTERMPVGYYQIQPVSWPNGRHRGYQLHFVNDKGALAGGLWHELGLHSSPNKAKGKALEHYQQLLRAQRLEGWRDKSPPASPAPTATNPRRARAPRARARARGPDTRQPYRALVIVKGRRRAVTFRAASDDAAKRYAVGLLQARTGGHCVSLKRSSARGRRVAGGRRRNPSELETAARAFEDFTGHEATRVQRFKGGHAKAGWLLGRVATISYLATRDGELAEYVHKFASRSRPQLVSSHDGSQLYLLGGAYSVTDRGIEDA